MEVDEELTSEEGSRCNSRASNGGRRGPSPGFTRTSQGIVLNRGLGPRSNTGEFVIPAPPGGSTSPHPSKLLLSARRSSSGIFISNMFSSRFRHLQKLHADAFLLGLNAVSYPGLPMGTMFRSSLPATPVSTPVHREGFHHFTEQALKERLCKTPSPRKNRGFSPHSSHSSSNNNHHSQHQHFSSSKQHQQQQHQNDQQTHLGESSSSVIDNDDSICSDQQMDTTSPLPPASILDDPLIEGGSDISESENLSFREASTSKEPSQTKDDQSGNTSCPKLFVRGIGYRKKDEMVKLYSKFFQKFGEVKYFEVIEDHFTKRPKGFGFVCFRDPESAERALAATSEELVVHIDEYRIRPLQVFPALEKTMSRVRSEVKSKQEAMENLIQTREEVVNKTIKGEIKRLHSESSSEQFERDSIERLDDDTILIIFSFIYDIKDRVNCEFVCRRWYQLMIRSWSHQAYLQFRSTFCLWNGPTLDTNTLFLILKKCPNLKILDLEKVSTDLDDKTCDVIAKCCPQLTKLILRETRLTRHNLNTLGKHCANLKMIDFANCTNVHEKGLWDLLNQKPNLECINISNVLEITGKCFYKLQCVKELDLSGCNHICDDAFSKLAQNCSTSLRALRAPILSNLGLSRIFENFINLEVLEIDRICEDPALGFSGLSNLRNLRVLKALPCFDDLNNKNLINLIYNCQKLEKLILPGANRISDVSVSLISKHCPNMVELDLSASKISDRAMESFGSFAKLERLRVVGTFITDHGAIEVITNCAKLLFLDVSQCFGVSLKTLSYAYDLVREDENKKRLIICYNFRRVLLYELDCKEELQEFDRDDYSGDSDQLSLGDEDEDDDGYILDGDLDSEEELS